MSSSLKREPYWHLIIKYKRLIAIGIFCVIFLVTRLPFLGYDEINPDAVNWHFRSEQFIVGLKSGDLLKTYQHYHPGVTLMWIMGVPIEIYRQINPNARVYNENNFIIQHQIAKYSLVFAQLAFSLLLIHSCQKILGFKKAFLGTSVFSFEPWFLGNSRLLHMDTLLALFIILALTYAYLYTLSYKVKDLVLCALFSGLAFLTKSLGALLIPVITVFLTLYGVTQITKAAKNTADSKSKLTKTIASIGIFWLFTILSVFALFPALWKNPLYVFSNIYNEGMRIGTRRGHEQFVMGQQVESAGAIFYPLVLALKTSPLIWIGVFLFVWLFAQKRIKNRPLLNSKESSFVFLLMAFYLLYFVGVSLVSKKIDRYIVVEFPFLGLLSTLGLLTAWEQLKNINCRITFSVAVAAVAFSTIKPLIEYYPYYFTYTNPFFGSSAQANKIIGQKPFGIGIWELKQLIIKKYGNDVPLGFIDRKPMSMIYKNSKLFDIRQAGGSKYDLIILGPNESMPQNVLDGDFNFVKTNSIYINGLEYWRIYEKQQ